MFDWHSEYMVIQARQQEMVAAARSGRWLAEARNAARSARNGRAQGSLRRQVLRGGARRDASFRRRLGEALILLGHRLQGGASPLLTPRSGQQ